MKNKLVKNTLMSLWKTRSRFISIMAIIAIGSAFFSGVKASCPYMKSSAQKYFNDQSLADVRIRSTLGFTDNDVSEAALSEEVGGICTGYSADLFIKRADENVIVTAYSYDPEDNINTLVLEEGRLPQSEDECLADHLPYRCAPFAVGEKVTLSSPDSESDISETLERTEYTIVGLVRSPMYISGERGSTTVGDGTVNTFLYIPESNFTYDAYTDLYITGKGLSDIDPFSHEYSEKISDMKASLEALGENRIKARCEELRSDFVSETAADREKLENAEKEYNSGSKTFETGETQLATSRKDYDMKVREFEQSKADLEAGLEKIEELRASYTLLEPACDSVEKLLDDYSEGFVRTIPSGLMKELSDIQELLDSFEINIKLKDDIAVYIITDPKTDPVTKATYHQLVLAEVSGIRSSLPAISQTIEEKAAEAENGSAALDEAQAQLDMYAEELERAEKQLEESRSKLDDAKAKIDDGYSKLNDAEEELEEALSDAKWYVLDRGEYSSALGQYGEDTERVDAIAKVFPLFFILVAALVCVCTMTRMVEEQRTEIGTLKALGFGKRAIAAQYLLYAAAASVVGSTLGVCIGLPLIPSVINTAYQSMYDLPVFETPFKWDYYIGCLGVSLLCTGISAMAACRAELITNPAALMRPKPPKSGRRILLERVTFIWKRMSFTHKVTFRNLFRYKSRFFMTVIGIAGCAGLLVTGFALRYAISSIVDIQYGDIFRYDAMAVVDTEAEQEELTELENALSSAADVESFTKAYQQTAEIIANDIDIEDCYVFAPEDAGMLDHYIDLRGRISRSHLTVSDSGAIINEKLARLLGVNAGGIITVNTHIGETKLRVIGVTENYTSHYVYVTKSTYSSLFGEDKPNLILMNTADDNVGSALSEELLGYEPVKAVVFTRDGIAKFTDLISSMNMVVVLIICFAGALTFVILFNLTNISITERTHELATIKVLGFYDGEVSSYVYRENIISSLLGIILGMGLGVVLEKFVVRRCELDSVMFNPDIRPDSFIYAALITAAFALFVNIVMHFKLQKIDMATSLKAIE